MIRVMQISLTMAGKQRVFMPQGSKLLTVKGYQGHAYLYILGNDQTDGCHRTIFRCFTGHPVDHNTTYISSIEMLLASGNIAMEHFFEVNE